jgi:diaminopimelate epimerase
MEPVKFWKMNGSGNDFILIDNLEARIREEDMGPLVDMACRRRKSVGADGVIFVVESQDYDFGWRFFNADGSEVEMCGNGSRCVARFAYLNGIAGRDLTFETLAGPVSAVVRDRVVKVLMPTPKDLARDVAIEHQEGWETADFINTGVPHVVIRVADIANHPVAEHGRRVRYDRHFAPEGANANFMMAVGQNQIKVRTYERGVEEETLACGTGAIASALTSSLRGLVSSPVSVKTSGGETLFIHFKRDGDLFKDVWLEGNTALVYRAELHDEALT